MSTARVQTSFNQTTHCTEIYDTYLITGVAPPPRDVRESSFCIVVKMICGVDQPRVVSSTHINRRRDVHDTAARYAPLDATIADCQRRCLSHRFVAHGRFHVIHPCRRVSLCAILKARVDVSPTARLADCVCLTECRTSVIVRRDSDVQDGRLDMTD
jgi:hypothetical protein